MNALRAALVLLLAGAAAPAASQTARFEVVGRGVVSGTRTTDLAVFRGADGRDYALTGSWGACRGCSSGRAYLWDVTDPARPVLADSVLVDAQTVADVAVDAAGRVGVLTRQASQSRRDGMVLLDLSDPTRPRVAADYFETVTGGVQNVAVEGPYVYAVHTGSAELHVIDASDPAAPRQVGQWGLPDRPGKYLQDVTVRDGVAYLAYWDDGVVILDVGSGVRGGAPQHPAQVGAFQYRTEWRNGEYGNTSFALPHTNRAGRPYLFVADRIVPASADFDGEVETAGFVHVLDVSNPRYPVEVARFHVPGAGVQNLWAEGDTLYAAHLNAGVRAWDVSGDLRGDLRGREVAALRTADDAGYLPGVPYAWGVQVYRGLVYATDFNSGLWIARLAAAP